MSSDASAARRSEAPARSLSQPVPFDFSTAVQRLWVQHDPMLLVGDDGPSHDLYEHQAYITSLCAAEVLSVDDAEKIVTTILRREYTNITALWSDAAFLRRVQGLAVDLFAACQARPRRVSTAPWRTR